MITLDVSTEVELEYLAEGAANVIYRITPHPSTPSIAADNEFYNFDLAVTEIAPYQIGPGLEGKLIRLHKAVASDCSVRESYEYYQNKIVPIFPRPEDRVECILFRPTLALISELNQQLKVMESRYSRPRKRCGTYLAEDEEHGLLITDMSCSTPSNANFKCFEFKPKWLVQSPSAPIDAVRCRTCALRNFRRAQSGRNSSAEEHLGFCPLGLVSKDRLVVERLLSEIFKWNSGEAEEHDLEMSLRQRLINLIYDNHLLFRLREMQSTLDPRGVLTISSLDFDFLTAMTLRDCTVFIKIPTDGDGKPEIRLGDLDFKYPGNGKGQYWKKIEEQLIEQNWYTAKENSGFKLDNLCLLTRGI